MDKSRWTGCFCPSVFARYDADSGAKRGWLFMDELMLCCAVLLEASRNAELYLNFPRGAIKSCNFFIRLD